MHWDKSISNGHYHYTVISKVGVEGVPTFAGVSLAAEAHHEGGAVGALGRAGEGLDAQLVRFGLDTQKYMSVCGDRRTHSGDIISGRSPLAWSLLSCEQWGRGWWAAKKASLPVEGEHCQEERRIFQEVELAGVVGEVGPGARRRQQGMARGAWSRTSGEQSPCRQAVVE